MSHSKPDCSAMFRMHALGLCRPAQPQRDHWMLRRDGCLRSWLAELAFDYGRLRKVDGDPFDGRPITGYVAIRALGFESRTEPAGMWEA